MEVATAAMEIAMEATIAVSHPPELEPAHPRSSANPVRFAAAPGGNLSASGHHPHGRRVAARRYSPTHDGGHRPSAGNGDGDVHPGSAALSPSADATLAPGFPALIASLAHRESSAETGSMLDILRRIIQDINAARDLNEALGVIVAEVKTAIHTDVCSVYMTDAVRGEHVLMATDGLRPGAVGKVRLKLGQGLVGLAASRAEPVNVDDAPAHPAFRYVAATGEAPFHGFIGVPIIRRRKVLGVLAAQQRERRKYTADEESFLVTLAAQLAGCINQAEIRQALDRLNGGDALADTLFLEGVASARGLAIGEAVVVFPATALDRVPDKDIENPEAEASRFRQAVAAELAELQRLSERMRLLLSAGDRALFDAYALLLGSDSLVNGTLERIYAGNWAPGALRATVLEYANIFTEMNDPYLRERAADILDLGQRLLNRLQEAQAINRRYPDHTILMGDEISVSQLLDVPPEQLKGLVSVRGTGASHVALLARGLGVPAVFGVSNLPPGRLNGREVVVDGYTVRVCIQPSPALRQEYLKLIADEAELSRDLQHLRDLPAETPDGHRLELHANSGLFADIAAARDSGVQGWGCIGRSCISSCATAFPARRNRPPCTAGCCG